LKKYIYAVLIITILAATALYFIPITFAPLNKAILYSLGKRFDAKIGCHAMKVKLFDSIEADGVRIKGIGGIDITIKKAIISYSLASLFVTDRLESACSLEDVKIYGNPSLVALVADFLSVETFENISFPIVKADFFIGKSDTITKNLTGASEDIIFFVDGLTRKDNSLMVRLKLFLSDKLTEGISQNISELILKDEEGPWSSAVIGVTGNYKSPSLRLLSDQFSLDLTTK